MLHLGRSNIFYVYLIRSLIDQNQTYIGYTTDVQSRLMCHNSGGSVHTNKYRPWKMVAYLGFQDKESALNFERYLKSQSGRAFANKRFW
jgi:putative endonuclease